MTGNEHAGAGHPEDVESGEIAGAAAAVDAVAPAAGDDTVPHMASFLLMCWIFCRKRSRSVSSLALSQRATTILRDPAAVKNRSDLVEISIQQRSRGHLIPDTTAGCSAPRVLLFWAPESPRHPGCNQALNSPKMV